MATRVNRWGAVLFAESRSGAPQLSSAAIESGTEGLVGLTSRLRVRSPGLEVSRGRSAGDLGLSVTPDCHALVRPI